MLLDEFGNLSVRSQHELKTRSVPSETLTLCLQVSSQFHLLMQVKFTHMSQTSKHRDAVKLRFDRSTRTDARNAFDGNLPNAFLKAREPRVHFSNLSLLPLYELLDDLRLDEEQLSPHTMVETSRLKSPIPPSAS